MDRRDQRFRFIHCEEIDRWSIFLRDAKALQARGWIVLLRMIAIAVIERTSQRTDDVVVGLLAERFRVDDLDQRRLADRLEDLDADLRPPDGIEDFSLTIDCRESEIVLGHARFAMRHELIEDIVAGARGARDAQVLHVSIVRKFLRE